MWNWLVTPARDWTTEVRPLPLSPTSATTFGEKNRIEFPSALKTSFLPIIKSSWSWVKARTSKGFDLRCGRFSLSGRSDCINTRQLKVHLTCLRVGPWFRDPFVTVERTTESPNTPKTVTFYGNYIPH